MWSDLTSTLSSKIRFFSSLPQTLRTRSVYDLGQQADKQNSESDKGRDDGARTSEPQRCESSRIFRCVFEKYVHQFHHSFSLSLSLFLLKSCACRRLVDVRGNERSITKKNLGRPLTAAGPCRIPPISSLSWAFPFARFLDFAAWCICV
jgi:hypothetical protein